VPQISLGAIGDRDVLTLSGPEPDMNWHRFASTVAQLAAELKVGRMVALGAYPFATPHTRPAHLSATSPSRELLDTLPFRTSSIDVPAGMAAALELALHERRIPAVGIWVQVPHYVATMSYPAASVSLLDGVGTATGLAVEAHGLRREAMLQRERLDRLVESNDEHKTMVAQFEELYDADDRPVGPATGDDAPPDEGTLEFRSGDEIAAEVERYLQDRGKS
jgi:predicted ATP-grasp superfamily ATP-dependent carboligase